jgi:hypothetical protein
MAPRPRFAETVAPTARSDKMPVPHVGPPKRRAAGPSLVAIIAKGSRFGVVSPGEVLRI